MNEANRWDVIAQFGISHVNLFVHLGCANALSERGPDRDRVLVAVAYLAPGQVVGRWSDVTACDHCRRDFAADDPGYLRLTLTSLRDLTAWIDVRETRWKAPEGLKEP
jgi:hypothetical protein